SSNGSDIHVDTQLTYPDTDPDSVARNDTYNCVSLRCALEPNAPAVAKMTARYVANEKELIPVYYNVNSKTGDVEEKDPRFAQAIANINEVIGRPVFKDMGFIHVDHDESDWLLDYSSVEGKGGLIFSVGTSVKINANQQTCGSASIGPNNMQIAPIVIDENNYFKADGGWVWLNLDSSDGTCLADVEIATHELMHALGFLDHFDGFGADGEVFGDRAKAALRTLYNNDAQSDPDNLTYYHWPAN
ncbi:hypothetical protein, partial [Photobacterium sp. BZF1]|uniref:hypothetical protein n=1 Tax=Photobacterium sp. BZF1 TaxID=1904457 RepID=UPI001CA40346